jgi:hypothetical protein
MNIASHLTLSLAGRLLALSGRKGESQHAAPEGSRDSPGNSWPYGASAVRSVRPIQDTRELYVRSLARMELALTVLLRSSSLSFVSATE